MALPSLLFVFTLLFVLSTAQYGAQSAVNVSFVANLHTTGQWVTAPTWLWTLVHLPDDYASTTTKYPLLVFFHGAGESTVNRAQSDLSLISSRYGPCAEVARGSTLQFTVAGVLYKFIAVCPQLWWDPTLGPQNARWDQTGFNQNNFITSISSLYRVDPNRIYLTGLSDGGYSTLGASVNSVAQAQRFAGIAPVDFTDQTNFQIPGMCNAAAASVPFWTSCGTADFMYSDNIKYPAIYNNCTSRAFTAEFHVIPGGQHDATSFNGAYNTGHTYNNPNLYEYLLANSRGGVSAPAPTPKPTSRPTPAPTPVPCPAPRIGSGTGLIGAYYNGLQSFTDLEAVRIDPTINFSWGAGAPLPAPFPVDKFTVRWNATLLAKFSGLHTFYGDSDDGIRIYVNNVLVVNAWFDRAENETSGTISLVAGSSYPLVVEYFDDALTAVAKVSWSAPCLAKEIIPQSQLSPPAFKLCPN